LISALSASTRRRSLACPVSIKDLFDVKGEATLAGSRVLADAAPAAQDAAIVQCLRRPARRLSARRT
jgi:aspartyl-tRNA(Asn)/glutamyl-tRNA(Gln) amidotransferase subunit A